ncbi:PQQ-dependent dehydrogenase, methanol/ethanol family [Sphingopyxis sp.]|uniref:PQQ-dependent dehydrogenase, methanol/ethanol family n=1 Tax=Sphingopyxis sp. TaxID=1908224 RepID=UPI002D78E9C8|nr:PQQ-dependent dehydrogenase, methanol/ethanol family [Sphingopyxis sp.]HET6523118.1 PQQ-dependent dehydrogenase, methanol/ethanol family [Sphingopyxis sp.]
MKKLAKVAALIGAIGLGTVTYLYSDPVQRSPDNPDSALIDWNLEDDWPAFGRTYGEQHYSPLAQIDRGSVHQLGLAWSLDLPAGNPVSGPIAVGGVLYTSTGYSVVRAINVTSGKLLWTFDPQAPERSGHKLRMGWGSRGLAWWNGKIYIGTQDGRLIAIDAKTGKQVWTQKTFSKEDGRFISGAPRVFDGKVIIGHGGADSWDVRGYVTTYDAETGKQLWRFYTVPGNPAKGFEDEAQAMAAQTWHGEWWTYGGGGTAWNSFTYDAETETVFVGTGNGAPWSHRIRSKGRGDNLFLCSVVALDAKTGKYKWHYQFNPGESWDYNASMDMQLADIKIDGKVRKVLMELPKNGFFYVIDRISGKLISADKVTEVTWASGIDLRTGRPIENPKARMPAGEPFRLVPGPDGAHTWLPSAYSPLSGLMYLPVAHSGTVYDEKGIPENWKRMPGNLADPGLNINFDPQSKSGKDATSTLLAWNPATREVAWKREMPGGWNGGILATAGQLVFQGDATGKFNAYDAVTGKTLWQFDAHVPVLAPPITYRHNGRQYVTVLAGVGTALGINSRAWPELTDYRTQPRRVLTFALGGAATIQKAKNAAFTPAVDPDYKADTASSARGAFLYGSRCGICHGFDGVSAGTAPELRASGVPQSPEAFAQIVREGALVSAGMPAWGEMSDAELDDLRQYIRSKAAEVRK